MLTTAYYPELKVTPNTNPNRLYAVLLIGGLVKFIMLIPVFIWMGIIGLVTIILIYFVNPFFVLFTGKYWRVAYEFSGFYFNLVIKSNLFMFGVSDKYPGFGSNPNSSYTIKYAYPENPSRFFAIPIIGIIVRGVLLIPFAVFYYLINYATLFAVCLFAWFWVLFKGRYPETAYELATDNLRLMLAQSFYGLGLSDQYPSFKISWNHKNLKLVLIALSVLFLLYSYIWPLFTPTKVDKTPKIPNYQSQDYYQQDPSNYKIPQLD